MLGVLAACDLGCFLTVFQVQRRVRDTLEPDLGNASEGKQLERIVFLPHSIFPSQFD
jgi:hypothetical protein